MRIGIEFEAFKAVTMEGIAEFHAAQVKADMNGPLADVCCLVRGVVGGFMVYPFRRVVTRKSPETIIQQSTSRASTLQVG